MAHYPYSSDLAERFTVETRFDGPVELFDVVGDTLLLPRGACPPPGKKEDHREDGSSIEVTSKVTPKNAEQARIIDASLALLRAGESLILEAATGVGKTVCSCDILSKIGRKTLVVVTKEDLLEQWRKSLLQHTDLSADDIGIIQQDSFEVEGRSVVLALVHSLVKPGKYPPSLRREFGLVIFDEVHRMGADTFSRAVKMFDSRLRLGLSATPNRTDGRDVIFKAHLGSRRVVSQKADLVPKVFYWESKWKVPSVVRYRNGAPVRVPMPHEAGKLGAVLNHLAEDQGRNAKILEVLLLCVEKQRRTVLFSDRRGHLDAIEEALVSAGVPQEEIVQYVGSASKATREKARTAKVVLATYGMMSEGTDIPTLDTCLIATPRAHVAQVVGRILRLAEGKKKPVVFDFIDPDSEILKGFGRSRLKWYASIGAEVVRMV